MVPTDIQKDIIRHEGNTVVLASPGSGKTFVISEMIRRVIKSDNLLPYQGVIAISYTRKASANLKNRAIGDGIIQKNSFFGTIDNFCLTQIIESFGCYVFGHPQKELEIIGIKDLSKDDIPKFEWIREEHPDYCDIEEGQISDLSSLFINGHVLVESLELVALHIIQNCKACRNYICARYKYIFIDEYQDADTYTNAIFLLLVEIGLIGVAVGDENQSIFGFAHKDSRYLRELKVNPKFTAFTLNENFRCAIPIINYSNRLLDKNSPLLKTDQDAVFLLRLEGAEDKIAEFIDYNISSIRKNWQVSDNCKIAILVRNGRTQKIIHETLSTPHRVVETTRLDEDLNPRSRLYTFLLRFYFDESMPFISVLDEYVDFEVLSHYDKKRLIEESLIIRSIEDDNYDELSIHFKRVADIILPRIGDVSSMIKLKNVLEDENALNSYMPVDANEVQLMTLHKSKGLEFDVVLHLNVCEWELPIKKIENDDFDHPIYPNWEQDLNLHYVGITRARKACIMIRGTKRTNNQDMLKSAKDSEFLNINNLQRLRRE
jgi:superfamily I DNA/RNA helicase